MGPSRPSATVARVSRLAGLTESLIDDAAVFPPGSAALADAVDAAYARVDTATDDLVGPLLVPASAAGALRELVDPDRPLRIALVADTGLEALESARDQLQDDPWVELVHVEVRLPLSDDAEVATKILLDALSFTVPAYVELPLDRDPEPALTVLAADGAERAKFRCGPDAVPTSAHLGRAIVAATRAGVPFKLTGGLHHALPNVQADVRHHGFLNALAATSAALSGDADRVVDLLDEDDPESVLAALTEADIPALRRSFRSFGSCSIDEPFDDLRRLGLVGEE